MKRILAVLALLGGFAMVVARPANPLSVGADLTLSIYQKLISRAYMQLLAHVFCFQQAVLSTLRPPLGDAHDL